MHLNVCSLECQVPAPLWHYAPVCFQNLVSLKSMELNFGTGIEGEHEEEICRFWESERIKTLRMLETISRLDNICEKSNRDNVSGHFTKSLKHL